MARTFQVTFDARDSRALADFWSEALGYVRQSPPARLRHLGRMCDGQGHLSR